VISDASGPVHATAVARHGPGGWRGVLLIGPSGAGKSDLALRLIARTHWQLVADDYAHVWTSGDAVYATAPTNIAARIEARGLGIIATPCRGLTRIVLAVACGQLAVDRMPEPQTQTVVGQSLPLLSLDIRPASAIDTLEAALRDLR